MRVTVVQRLRVRRECPANPFFVMWLTPQGGWVPWLFHGRQFKNLDTYDPRYIERWNYDIEQQDTKLDFLSKKAGEKITVAATDLDENDVAVLRTLLSSVKVMVMTNNNPLTWMTVLIDPGSWTIADPSRLLDIEVTFILPELNLQHQ